MSRRNPPSSGDEWDLADVEDRAAEPDAVDHVGSNEDDDIPFGDAEESGEETGPAWDADDERRQKDCFAPPQEPCECYCLHCGRTFMSDRIWFQRIIGDPMGLDGFWMCPTPNCSGAGFTFDIFPTDPTHPANEGWCYDDGDEDECEDEEFGELDPEDEGATSEAAWDPDESKYKELDEMFGERADDEDIEGEEWKYGLAPGDRPPEPDWMEQARREREEEERRYAEPDERPPVLDWTDREDRKKYPASDEDIPF